SHITGKWDKAFQAMADRLAATDNVTILTNCMILKADLQDGCWNVDTEEGSFVGKSLVVAQSPWEALNWLAKPLWPSEILSMAIKTKATSVVVLTESITAFGDHEIPEVVLIPAESVQVIVTEEQEICYQATLDFEVSLQAPDVVKAVKRLKRARKKLH